jgi:hypothetical protein
VKGEEDDGPLIREAKGGGGCGCVEGGCLHPEATRLHGPLDLEAEKARRKKTRTGSATSASMVVNPDVLGLGFKTQPTQERRRPMKASG